MTLNFIRRIEWSSDQFLPPNESFHLDERQREKMFVIAHFVSPICVIIPSPMLFGLAGMNTPLFFGIALGFSAFYAHHFPQL